MKTRNATAEPDDCQPCGCPLSGHEPFCDIGTVERAKMNDRCPNCGYCPHCGRSDKQFIPNPYPYPVYPLPYWPGWTRITVGPNVTITPNPTTWTIQCDANTAGSVTTTNITTGYLSA